MAKPLTMQGLAERFAQGLREIAGWRKVLGEIVDQMLSIDTQDRAVEVIRKVAPNARQVLGFGASRAKTDKWSLTKADIMALRQEYLLFHKNGGLRYENHFVSPEDLDTLDLPQAWRAKIVDNLANGSLRVKDLADAVKQAARGRKDKGVERLMAKVEKRQVQAVEVDDAPIAIVDAQLLDLNDKIERAEKRLAEMVEHRKRLLARRKTLDAESVETARLTAQARAAEAQTEAKPKRKRVKASIAAQATA